MHDVDRNKCLIAIVLFDPTVKHLAIQVIFIDILVCLTRMEKKENNTNNNIMFSIKQTNITIIWPECGIWFRPWYKRKNHSILAWYIIWYSCCWLLPLLMNDGYPPRCFMQSIHFHKYDLCQIKSVSRYLS